MSTQLIMLQDEPRGPSMLIEIPVTANGQQRVPVGDINQLRSTVDQMIILKGLRLITANVLTNGIINGSVTAPVAELQKMVLTIYAEGWEKGQSIPLLPLNDVTLPGGAIPHRYGPTYFDNWVRVDWPKSFIQFANGTVSANAPYVVILDCLYQKLDGKGQPIMGAS